VGVLDCNSAGGSQGSGLSGEYEYRGENPAIVVTQKFSKDSLYHAKTTVADNCLDYQARGKYRIDQDSICNYSIEHRTRTDCETEFKDWIPAQDYCSKIRNVNPNGYEMLGEDINANPIWIKFSRPKT
jgi:hypothetical protein